MNNSRNPKTLSFLLEETLKDQRGIFFIDKCLSDTFKIHYNNILAGSNTVQGSNISIIQLYRESGIELLILNSPLSLKLISVRGFVNTYWLQNSKSYQPRLILTSCTSSPSLARNLGARVQ